MLCAREGMHILILGGQRYTPPFTISPLLTQHLLEEYSL